MSINASANMDKKDREFLDKTAEAFYRIESPEHRRITTSIVHKYTDGLFRRIYNDEALKEEKSATTLQDVLKIGQDRVPFSELVQVFDTGVVANTGANDIEKSVIDWLTDILGFPNYSRGTFVSGSSMGVVLAMNAARDKHMPTCQHLERSVIYMTDQSHFSNRRSMRVAGLGYCQTRVIAVDSNFKMDVHALEKTIVQDKKNGLAPCIVLGTVGSTNVGMIDPIEEISKLAQKHNLWFHVDGAYGGFFLINELIKTKCKGIEDVDSITVDCHKGLSAPFGTSIVLVRNGELLRRSMKRDHTAYLPEDHAAYLPEDHEAYLPEDHEGKLHKPLDYSFEVTRPFRGFPVWFALRYLGTRVIEQHIEEKLKLTNYLYDSICKIPNIQVLMKPELSIVVFRYCPPKSDASEDDDVATRILLSLILEDGSVYLTPTTVQGTLYIRFCVLSFRSHLPEVNLLLTLIREKTDWLNKRDNVNKCG